MKDKTNYLRYGLVYLIFIIGFLLILIGIYQKSETSKILLLSIGGAIGGASLSTLVANIAMPNFLNIIDRMLTIPYLSNDQDNLNRLRTVFWEYHLTIKEGKLKWLAVKEDYSLRITPNYIYSAIHLINNGKKIEYDIIGLLFVDKLIKIIISPSNKETPAVAVFNKIMTSYADYYVGCGSFQNWDSEDIVLPTIMSKKPIVKNLKQGFIEDKQIIEKLNLIVQKEIDFFRFLQNLEI